MVTTHYRWDFIGLSTDTKPTPETSEKVVDGSTYYCSDNSKLYVWCKNQWYEKEVSGGGGGTSYTAGTGIDITDNTISVDTTDIQTKLTAGSNITIEDDTISATDTTYSNFTGTDGTSAGTAGLVPAPATTDAGKFLKADGTWDTAGGGGGTRTLTEADYNYHSSGSTDDGIALWLLDEGQYIIEAGANYYAVISSKSYAQQNTGVVILVKPTGTGSNERGGFIVQEQNRTLLVSRIDSTGNNGKQDEIPRSVANNLTTSTSGYALDARQGKVLKGLIDALDARVTALEGN